MNESQFQFTNPELKKLRYITIENFRYVESFVLDTKIATNISTITEEGNESFATIEVTITIGKEDDSQPFFIEATESANFKWKNGVFNDDFVDNLLKKNAPALLISYLRPILSNITGFSRYPAYNLPFVDLSVTDN